MSFTSNSRKFPHMSALAVRAKVEEEGTAAVARFVERKSAKVVAIQAGITPRHVYNLRGRECKTTWPTFIMLAMQDAELRALVGGWLGFVHSGDPRAAAALDQIRRIVETVPEEGDQTG